MRGRIIRSSEDNNLHARFAELTSTPFAEIYALSKRTLLVSLAIWLSACASGPTTPPQVEESASAPIQREVDPAPETDIESIPQSTAATATLLAAAKTALDDDQPRNAVAYLERAVRIDPRNPQLWIKLSAAHLADGNIAAANQHARKAIALAGNDTVLIRDAWLQMADIRDAEGNTSEAKAIRRRYRSVSG